MSDRDMYYGDYLQLDKILNAQDPESEKVGWEAHDEMLFIIIHQTYELWFKQIRYELGSVLQIFKQNSINDNSADIQVAVDRLRRIATILRVAVQQIDIMETMTPLDFLDFRNLLRPASGFQSIQFKIVEAALGLRMDQRHGKEYYLSQLRPEDVEKIKEVEASLSLLDLVNKWLERLPYFEQSSLWNNYASQQDEAASVHPFWSEYRKKYDASLSDVEQINLTQFDSIILSDSKQEGRSLSPKANRAALFIMLYRNYPLLHLPYRLIESLLDIDELLATWRYRHMNMVHRIIGRRIGTGGSTGRDYLLAALNKHYIFKDFADLNSFLIERRNLPELSSELVQKLSYN